MNRPTGIKGGDVLCGTALVGNVRIFRYYQVCGFTEKSYRVVDLPASGPLSLVELDALRGTDRTRLVRQVPSLRYGYIAGTRIVLSKKKEEA